jgi:hypothetical protein
MSESTSGASSIPAGPSVKGTALLSVVEDYHRLVENGVITEEDQTKDLTPDDLEVLNGLVTPIGWYPIGTYCRAMDLLARKEGDGDRENYLIARGYRAAERLMGATYHRFDPEPGSWGPRVGETLAGLGSVVYNFSSWHFRDVEPGVFEFEVRDAAEFPDAARFTAQGFLNFAASRASGRVLEASSHRPDAQRIVYRIDERG